jgi:ABC-type transporter Mla MlaB component
MSEYTLQRQGSTIAIALKETLHVGVVPELKELIAAAVEDGVMEVTLDFSATKELDASGLELLLAIKNSLYGEKNSLRLTHVPRNLFSLLKQLRVVERLNAQME